MRPNVAAIALTFALATNGGIHAQTTSCQPHLVGADRRGPAQAISRSGDTLYLAAGAAVVVVDTTDITAPVERGHVDLDELALDVAHWQTTAIALGEHGLTFIDAADPVHPAIVGRFPFPAGWVVNTATAREDRAYVPEANGLHVLDFTDPSAPVEIGSFAASDVRDVVLNGDRAYLLVGAAVLVLDISNPAAPVELNSVAISAHADDRLRIAGNGGRLAAFGGWCVFVHCFSEAQLFSLANPDFPAVRSTLDYSDWSIEDVEFVGNRAYVSELVYDVSDLANPVYLGSLWPLLQGQDMARTPDLTHLFVADPRSGLQVADVADPANPSIAASIAMPGEARDGYLTGSTAVVVYADGLRTFDVSDPTHPARLGHLDLPNDFLQDVVRVGDHAYATGAGPSNDSVGLFDLSDPAHPAVEGTLGSNVHRPPALSGRRLYLADDCNARIRIYDVSNPGSPLELGTVELGDQCYMSDFAAGAGKLYVWDYGSSSGTHLLRTFDVSNPAAPVELGATEMNPWHRGRSLERGGYLLLTDDRRIDVVDVRDPDAAARVATLPLPVAIQYERGLTRYGSLVFVSTKEQPNPDPVFLVDFSNPLEPAQLAAIQTPGSASGAAAGPGLILVADGPAGISVYESCEPFADGFESGDASAWSAVQP